LLHEVEPAGRVGALIMSEERVSSKEHYRRFVEQVRETGEVWGLRGGEEEWAYCDSNEFEDTEVLLFWSDRAEAARHAQGEWSGHRPTVISLDKFIDQWLSGMDEDGALVGANWDADLHGLEMEPRDLAADLLDDETD